jgi:hypothetical protein
MFDDQRRVVVSRRVNQTVERQTVAACKGMNGRRWRCVMAMGDMREGVDRERQQQRREGNSQPLRRTSGQVQQTHVRQRMTVERPIGYGEGYRL